MKSLHDSFSVTDIKRSRLQISMQTLCPILEDALQCKSLLSLVVERCTCNAKVVSSILTGGKIFSLKLTLI
ncbi:hypothetical protein H803_YJM1381P00375 [Saccharomyces cerevisiae YJM1381]|nr:hypothetical protein H803_YJM1381P00375 [Saccharomyces cerevisiae YJM1381]